MYAQFFGLAQEPFSIAPDPRYLFMSRRHREALAHLLYGLNGGGGFVLLSGEIGAGKTTVCRCFLEQIPKRTNVAYIFNPKLTVTELLKSVCDEFRITYAAEGPGPATVKDYIDPLNEFLLRTHAVGQNNVLIIDEAQMLSAEVLEQLRLLTNLETNERKLLQIVLIGQPELRTLVARPELEQLAQRVIARFHLKALSPSETGQYIRHRLGVAGLTHGMPFDARAIERIHQLSRGIPRRINLICDRAMLGAYGRGSTHIGRDIVDKAAAEVFGRTERVAAPSRKRRSPAWLGAGLALAAVAGAAGYFIAVDRSSRGDSAVAASPAASAASASASSARAGAAGSSPGAQLAGGGVGGAPGGVLAAGAAASGASAPGVGAGSTTSAAGAAGTPLFIAPAELESAFGPLQRDENAAWRELAALWKVDVRGDDPCAAAQAQNLRCFRTDASLEVARRLGRPAILTLRDAAGRPAYALLTGLTEQAAVLQMSGVSKPVSLVSLGRLWPGEMATLWRTVPGYNGPLRAGDTGPVVEDLVERLAKVDGEPRPSGPAVVNAALRSRVSRFQASRGLEPDGVAGPTTLMQLHRATGSDEPSLRAPAT